MEDKRRSKRISRRINMHYCIAGELNDKWDMSIIENISTGGIRFSAPADLKLKDKIVRLRIMIPEIVPNVVELEALIVDVNPHSNGVYSHISAKFINLSDSSKERLSVVEKMVEK